MTEETNTEQEKHIIYTFTTPYLKRLSAVSSIDSLYPRDFQPKRRSALAELAARSAGVELEVAQGRHAAFHPGRTAELLTGHCLLFGDRRHVETSTTTVHFAHASEADIAAYARSGEPLQCAGAFTLEAMGGWFIDRIEGDPSSVIGLSLPVVRRALYSFDLNVSDFW